MHSYPGNSLSQAPSSQSLWLIVDLMQVGGKYPVKGTPQHLVVRPFPAQGAVAQLVELVQPEKSVPNLLVRKCWTSTNTWDELDTYQSLGKQPYFPTLYYWDQTGDNRVIFIEYCPCKGLDQAVVDTESKLIVTAHITQQSNDKQELEPTLKNLAALPKQLGTVTELLADSGYFSETNVNACAGEEITPFIAVDRQNHNRSVWERFKEPPPLSDDADSVTTMKHRLKTKAGKAIYALRKVTSEPVFGIIKAVMGFRVFMLRGKESVSGEWNLACMAYNIKRMHSLKMA